MQSTLTESAVAAERELVPGEKGDPLWADSLKTEEKTRFIDSNSSGGRILRHSSSDR